MSEKPKKYKYLFIMGDPSHDGHEKTCEAFFQGNVPAKEIHAIMHQSKALLGFDMTQICYRYGDNHLSSQVTEYLLNNGFEFTKEEIEEMEMEDGECIEPPSIDSDTLFRIWAFLLNKMNPNLEVEKIETRDYEIVSTHMGYGLF